MSSKIYQVREIIGKRELRGRTLYKISWEGFSSDEDSWEPETNLIGCEPLIDEFNRRSWSPSPVPPEPSPKRATRSPAPPRKEISSSPKLQETSRAKPKQTSRQKTPEIALPKLRSALKPPTQLPSRSETSVAGSSPSKRTRIPPRRSLAGTTRSKRQSTGLTTSTTTETVILSANRPLKTTPSDSPPISSRVRTRLHFTAATTKKATPTSSRVPPQQLPSLAAEKEPTPPMPAEKEPTPPMPAEREPTPPMAAEREPTPPMSAVDQTPQETQPDLASSSSTQAETEETVAEQEVPGWLELGWAQGLLGLSVATVVGLGWYAYSTV